MKKYYDYVTVVYEIMDQADWEKTNPLHYEHNGLKAIRVAMGNQMERIRKFEELCNDNLIDTDDLVGKIKCN